MECKYCGHEIADTDKMCVFCGRTNEDYVERELTEEEKQQDWQESYDGFKASVERNGKASLKSTILAPIIFVVLCAIVGSSGCTGVMAASLGLAMFIKGGLIVCGLFGLLFSYGSLSSYKSLRKMIDRDEEEEPTGYAMAVLGLILALAEIIIPIVLLVNSCSSAMY